MSGLTRDGTVEPDSRDEVLKCKQGQEIMNFSCSADHERDWQPYPVDLYSGLSHDYTYIHAYTSVVVMRLSNRLKPLCIL